MMMIVLKNKITRVIKSIVLLLYKTTYFG